MAVTTAFAVEYVDPKKLHQYPCGSIATVRLTVHVGPQYFVYGQEPAFMRFPVLLHAKEVTADAWLKPYRLKSCDTTRLNSWKQLPTAANNEFPGKQRLLERVNLNRPVSVLEIRSFTEKKALFMFAMDTRCQVHLEHFLGYDKDFEDWNYNFSFEGFDLEPGPVPSVVMILLCLVRPGADRHCKRRRTDTLAVLLRQIPLSVFTWHIGRVLRSRSIVF